MKYSKTVLQAELTRFENGIKALNEQKKNYKDDKKQVELCRKSIKNNEDLIKELKADIAKL